MLNAPPDPPPFWRASTFPSWPSLGSSFPPACKGIPDSPRLPEVGRLSRISRPPSLSLPPFPRGGSVRVWWLLKCRTSAKTKRLQRASERGVLERPGVRRGPLGGAHAQSALRASGAAPPAVVTVGGNPLGGERKGEGNPSGHVGLANQWRERSPCQVWAGKGIAGSRIFLLALRESWISW